MNHRSGEPITTSPEILSPALGPASARAALAPVALGDSAAEKQQLGLGKPMGFTMVNPYGKSMVKPQVIPKEMLRNIWEHEGFEPMDLPNQTANTGLCDPDFC